MRKPTGQGKIKKICNSCKSEFLARHDRPGIYCSKSCASKNKRRQNYKIIKKCLVCDKEFKVKRYRKESAKYCSPECRQKRMPKKENHPNWKGGVSGRPFKVKQIIKQLKAEYKKCQDCGITSRLQGHHILSYKKYPELRADPKNIKIVCKNCHKNYHPKIRNFIEANQGR